MNSPEGAALRLYEFQAKEIFAERGIKVPRGCLARTPAEAAEAAEVLGTPVVVKAQVLEGGRGLAGGVKFADGPDAAREVAAGLLGRKLKRETVRSLLVEEKIPAEREYFAGATVSQREGGRVVIASPRGGVDIESIALEHPDEVAKARADLRLGLTDFTARRLARRVGLRGRSMLAFAAALRALYAIMNDCDAVLVEANPLSPTADGQVVALDAKIILDDGAAFRHRELFSRLRAGRPAPEEGSEARRLRAEEAEVPTYMEMGGVLGVIADGAGTGMFTLDLTRELGGEVEAYCELGGRANPKLMEAAMGIVLSNPRVRVLLVNLIGGLNRMDEMARGIVACLSKAGPRAPGAEVVVRMSGTLEEEGRAMLRAAGVASYDDIYQAVERAVGLARRI